MRLDRIPYLTWVIWIILAGATVFALATQHWSNVFVIVTALFLSVLPPLFSARFNIRLPLSFLAAISLFVFGTLFLGEVFDFYNRFWWWDVLLHGAQRLVASLRVYHRFVHDWFHTESIRCRACDEGVA